MAICRADEVQFYPLFLPYGKNKGIERRRSGFDRDAPRDGQVFETEIEPGYRIWEAERGQSAEKRSIRWRPRGGKGQGFELVLQMCKDLSIIAPSWITETMFI